MWSSSATATSWAWSRRASTWPHAPGAAIKAEWKPGPAVSDKDLFRELKQPGGQQPGGRGGGGGGRGGSGAGPEGLAAADVRSEQTYTIAYIAHAPLEPRAAVAEWKDGKLTVWTGTQRPFGVRGELARALRHAGRSRARDRARHRHRLRRQAHRRGGRRGGAAGTDAGRPVKLRWTREEEFTWAYFRPAGVIDIHAGVDGTATLTAWEFDNYNSGASGIERPYDVANQRTSSTRPTRRCARARTGRWRRRPTTSPASRTWTSWRRRPAPIRWSSA